MTQVGNRRPLRVLIQSRAFYPGIGGVERSGELLARALAREGHSVVVLTDTMLGSSPEVGPFEVERTTSRRRAQALVSRADIVHTNGFSLRLIPECVRQRKPLIVKHAGLQAICVEGNGLHGALRCGGSVYKCATLAARQRGWVWACRRLGDLLVRRMALRVPVFNIAVSHWVAGRIRAPRTVVIWNAIDTSERVSLPQNREWGRFAFFGRLVPEKGVDVLLRALSLLQRAGVEASLDIYGGGPETKPLTALCGELGLGASVRFRGPLVGRDLQLAQARAWVVVVPSTCEEAMGLVAVEAMWVGAPVIVSRDGGLAEVSEGCSLTFENGSPNQLAEAMRALLQQESLWHQLASAGPQRASLFGPERVAEEHVSLFEQALRQRR